MNTKEGSHFSPPLSFVREVIVERGKNIECWSKRKKMENIEHHCIPIEELDSDNESSIRSTNETEESIDDASVALMQQRLEDFGGSKIQIWETRSSVCIFRAPQSFREISGKAAIDPEMVSIGPYHHGKDQVRRFESYKCQYLCSLLSRTEAMGVDLRQLMKAMKGLESEARSCYSEPIPMSSKDFIDMMVLDGCFIVELLHQVCESQGSENDNIPIFRRDLLKLENQLPLFVLQKLYDFSIGNGDQDPHRKFRSDENPTNITMPVLKFFRVALPMSLSSLERAKILKRYHLLDLFHESFQPSRYFEAMSASIYSRSTSHGSQEYSSPLCNRSMPCVTQLRLTGIKFSPAKSTTDSFLEINFDQGVIEIQPITINDFTSTAFINCAALEQCLQHTHTCFSAYIAFMSCLINSARDVTFLCDDGIIANSSYNDLRVAHLFKKLGENVEFNIRDLYLSKQFRDVEAYYRSHWASLRRKYFSNPWRTISVVTASVLLLLAGIQAIMNILSYEVHRN
ncbi:UPF0481 protein [Camellia lanceoleosa]|uniref:UPF0481 protein n=1 Tax=Camellia lanceoleosa TaxID=1840588 RepID=A0ACC0G8I4_9ERIC|nr:UPF0481 protein [Camellia lanceoleosa]